jgi:hypothetical protein
MGRQIVLPSYYDDPEILITIRYNLRKIIFSSIQAGAVDVVIAAMVKIAEN